MTRVSEEEAWRKHTETWPLEVSVAPLNHWMAFRFGYRASEANARKLRDEPRIQALKLQIAEADTASARLQLLDLLDLLLSRYARPVDRDKISQAIFDAQPDNQSVDYQGITDAVFTYLSPTPERPNE